MLFKTEKNWKEFLSIEDEETLNEILRKTAKHRGAYKNSDEIKLAQLWCALIELKRENVALYKKIKKMEFFFNGMIERIKKEITEEKDIIKDLEKF